MLPRSGRTSTLLPGDAGRSIPSRERPPIERNLRGSHLEERARDLQDLWDLLVAYAKQETIDPLRNLGRYLGFGLAGMALLTLGTFFLAMSLLRALQTMIGGVFDGFWSWVPVRHRDRPASSA